MKHADNLFDNKELFGGYLEPKVECVHEFCPNIFPGRRRNVDVGFENFLLGIGMIRQVGCSRVNRTHRFVRWGPWVWICEEGEDVFVGWGRHGTKARSRPELERWRDR